jgi:hypothetical protein
MPFSPATSRPKTDDMATTSLRVGRLARWPSPISKGQPAKLQGRLDHRLRALCLRASFRRDYHP